MTMSYICSYVHYRKTRRSLQEHAGSFINRDGTFGAVVWMGSVGIHECGGTQKNMTCRTRHGAGVRGSAQHPHVTSRPTRFGGLGQQRPQARQAVHATRHRAGEHGGRDVTPSLPLCSSPGPYSAGTVVLGQPSQATTRARCAAVASGCTSNCQYLGGSAPNVTARRCRRSRRATSTVTCSPGR
jgi:hypothetical protein